MTVLPSPELAGRLVLARAITADFERLLGTVRDSDMTLNELGAFAWCRTLHTALAGLIRALDAASGPVAPGGALISGRDLMTVLGALSDATDFRAARGDSGAVAAYRSLARALGDDR